MIKLTRSKTVCLTVYSLENIKDILNDQIKFTKIDQLFQETLLMELRGKSISYSDYKKKEAETREKDITKNIEILESNFSESSSKKNRLDTLKEEHSIIHKNKMQGILLKSRTQIVEDVEKNIKRFCNLEKHNYNSKIMPNLEINQNGGLYDWGMFVCLLVRFSMDMFAALVLFVRSYIKLITINAIHSV